MKKTVAVIFGGRSNEYRISLLSAAAVLENLPPDKYEAVPIGITRQGAWFRYYGGPEQIRDDSWHTHRDKLAPAFILPDAALGGVLELDRGQSLTGGQGLPGGGRLCPLDAAFPVLHGKFGEDGTVQGLIELAGIPLVGCGTLSSALGMDKKRAHRLVSLAGVKTPAGRSFGPGDPWEAVVRGADEIGYPLFVKPRRGGSSIGISRVTDQGELPGAVKRALEQDELALIEQAIPGFEVGCAVMGNESLTLGEVDEIQLADGFFDFGEKYNLTTSKIHVPARISPETARRVKETARVIYKALGCRVLARVDMFLTPGGEIYFNEVNTIPGFTAHSRFPGMMRAAGMSYSRLLDSLVSLALERPVESAPTRPGESAPARRKRPAR